MKKCYGSEEGNLGTVAVGLNGNPSFSQKSPYGGWWDAWHGAGHSVRCIAIAIPKLSFGTGWEDASKSYRIWIHTCQLRLRFCLSAGPAVCYVDGAVYFSPVIVGIALPSLQEIDGGALFVVAAMGWLGLGVKALVLCGRREFFLLHCICLDFPLPAVGSSRVDLWCGFVLALLSVCSFGVSVFGVVLVFVDALRLRESTLADSYTYYTVSQDCIAMKSLEDGKIVHSYMIKTGHNQEAFSQNSLINMYAECESLTGACQVFDKMSARDAFSWDLMTAASVQTRHFEEALKLFSALQRFGINPNEFAFSNVLKSCSSVEALEVGNQFFAYNGEIGCQSSSFVGNAPIELYDKCGRFKNARHLFDKMVNRNFVSWNSMITGYTPSGECAELEPEDLRSSGWVIASSQGLMGDSRRRRHRGDLWWTLEKVWRSLETRKDLSAMEVVSKNSLALSLFKNSIDSNVAVGTVLLDMYVKCGSVEGGHRVFNGMSEGNVVSWTDMIAEYGQHGNAEKTQTFPRDALSAVTKADEYTF
ncbi:pentatricopeptide repeat-containing protein At4g33170-like [Cryptomeria japonica]|uniref:pentatricopeptide repeat-containing protein At4g33170-like n=1 Tax=Cryptomeria japonica TaxID=3369 RepID=UPI0027DA8421|nr:pentatricopeptide repeat-containing protein At4g33170-like [Cryptomeria japonica]